MLLKLLTPVILWAYRIYKSLFHHANYRLINATLEYTIDPKKKYNVSNNFWYEESKYWSPYNTEHYCDITKINLRDSPLPENIIDYTIRVKYYYNNKIYKYITKDIEYDWPPRASNEMGFNMPISKALLVDSKGNPKRDITEKFCRYAGPKNNFFGEEILIRDILYYTDETLNDEYPYLIISDVLGNVKMIGTDKTTHQLF